MLSKIDSANNVFTKRNKTSMIYNIWCLRKGVKFNTLNKITNTFTSLQQVNI